MPYDYSQKSAPRKAAVIYRKRLASGRMGKEHRKLLGGVDSADVWARSFRRDNPGASTRVVILYPRPGRPGY